MLRDGRAMLRDGRGMLPDADAVVEEARSLKQSREQGTKLSAHPRIRALKVRFQIPAWNHRIQKAVRQQKL